MASTVHLPGSGTLDGAAAYSRSERPRAHVARTNVPEGAMNPILLILIIVLVLAAFGGLPSVGLLHLGYFPSGIAGLLVLVLVILLVTGRL